MHSFHWDPWIKGSGYGWGEAMSRGGKGSLGDRDSSPIAAVISYTWGSREFPTPDPVGSDARGTDCGVLSRGPHVCRSGCVCVWQNEVGCVAVITEWVAIVVFRATVVLVWVFYHSLVLLDQNRIFSHWKNSLRSTGLALLFRYFIIDV